MPHDSDRIFQPSILVQASVNEILQSPHHIKVPLRQLREACATRDCQLARAMGLVEPVAQKELSTLCLCPIVRPSYELLVRVESLKRIVA